MDYLSPKKRLTNPGVNPPGTKTNEGPAAPCAHILGGSWVVKSGVISRVTTVITHIRGLITPLITTNEPPSTI